MKFVQPDPCEVTVQRVTKHNVWIWEARCACGRHGSSSAGFGSGFRAEDEAVRWAADHEARSEVKTLGVTA